MLTEGRTRLRTRLKVVRTLVHRVALDLLLDPLQDPRRGSMPPLAVLLRHRPLQSPRSRSKLIDNC